MFDTLWRNMPGGNENDASDMGRAVASGDLVRRRLGGHVLFTHHEPRAESGRLQGSNVLPRAIRTSFRLVAAADDKRRLALTCTKMNDGPRARALALKLTPQDGSMVVDADPEGQAAVEETGAPVARAAITPNRRRGLDVLAGRMGWSAWFKAFDPTETKRSAFNLVVKWLVESGLVSHDGEAGTYERNQFAVEQDRIAA